MPPNVHKGVVRGHYKQAYPTVQKFCACNECLEYWSIDRGSNYPVRGQYLGHEEWKRHRSRALKKGIASELLARTPDNPLTPPPLFETPALRPDPTRKARALSIPHSAPKTSPQAVPQSVPQSSQGNPHPDPKPVPTTPQPTPTASQPARFASKNTIPKKTVSNSIKFDFFKTKLKDIQRALKNSQVTDVVELIRKDPLVFVHTPTQHTPAPPSYALDGAVAKNSTVIGHEEWLVQTLDFINVNLHKEPRDSHSRLLAKTLVTQAQQDLAYLRKAIVAEWLRQQGSSATARLDTCK